MVPTPTTPSPRRFAQTSNDDDDDRATITAPRMPLKPPPRPTVKKEEKTNPFRITQVSERERHFPPLDQAFALTTTTSALSESVVSVAMSISAQAALQQHNRHVARYGLDGSGTAEHCVSGDSSTQDESSLDQKWGILNSSAIAPATVDDDDDTCARSENEQPSRHKNIIPTSVGHPVDEAIEVMTDQSLSYDAFFRNSSIELLKTPDSCRGHARQWSPTHRSHRPTTSSVTSCNTTAASETEIKAMLRLAGCGSPVSKFDITGDEDDSDDEYFPFEQALSLDRVNLSRISASESVVLRSNNNSLLLNQSAISTCSASTYGGGEPPLLDNKRLLQHKFVSSPFLNTSGASCGQHRTASPLRLPPRQRWSPRRYPLRRLDTSSNQQSTDGSSSGVPEQKEVTVAEAIEDAALVERGTTELGVIRSCFATSPLPPPGEGVGNSFLQTDGSFLSDTQQHNLSSITPNTSSDLVKSPASGARAASPSPTSVLLPPDVFAVGDRRRYRTVVPKRVFLSEPSQFPLEEDSFSGGSSIEVCSTPHPPRPAPPHRVDHRHSA